MGAERSDEEVSTPEAPAGPVIYRATLASNGDVRKVDRIEELQAVAERQAGRDVVVCGDNLSANRSLAQRIEQAASGTYQRHPPHAYAGPGALPHFQPDPRPPAGHTFYETPHRRAK